MGKATRFLTSLVVFDPAKIEKRALVKGRTLEKFVWICLVERSVDPAQVDFRRETAEILDDLVKIRLCAANCDNGPIQFDHQTERIPGIGQQAVRNGLGSSCG